MSKCALHPFSEGTHYCTGCDRNLCEDCGERLAYCGACGAQVVRIGQDAPDHWVDTLFDTAVTHTAADGPGAFVTMHILVPAAIIGMVYSLLFYVLLLRSIFFGNTGVLQWVGFLFIFATVLTARYGATRNDRGTQAAYSLVMLIATGMALATRSSTTAAMVSSMGLLAVVWLYATGVTFAMSLEGKRDSSTRGAVAPVVALALIAMVVFAIGEPLMLNAEPEVAIQALLTIIVYLLCTGVALAAASTMSQARRAHCRGGETVLGVMLARVGTAAAIIVAVMALALVLPGVHYSGSGRIQRAPDDVLQQRPFSLGADATAGQLGSELVEGLPWGWLSGFESMTTLTGQGSAALAVVRFMQYLGAAVGLMVALGALALCVRGRGQAFGWFGEIVGGWMQVLRSWWASRAPAWVKASGGRGSRSTSDPFADLEALGRRPAREAVLEAYVRSTVVLERLGHPRTPAATPYDILAALPERLAHLSAPLRDITGLYVVAAYSDETLGETDRDEAIATLVTMRDSLATGGA